MKILSKLVIIWTILINLTYARSLEPEKHDCVCQFYSDCTWSKKVVKQMAVLSQNSSHWNDLHKQMKNQMCDQKELHVWCCRNGQQATSSELEALNSQNITEVRIENDESIDKSGLYILVLNKFSNF